MGIETSFHWRLDIIHPGFCIIPCYKHFSETTGILSSCLDDSRSAVADLYCSESFVWYVVMTGVNNYVLNAV